MIIIRKNAVLDARQKKVLSAIEPFTMGMDLEATRGHSKPDEQQATIAKYAKLQSIKFDEFIPGGPVDVKKSVPGRGLLYHWQRTWEALLLMDVVVNPPLDTVCGIEYVRPSGENMLGKVIKASPHIIGENNFWPIDFSSKVNGIPNINLVRDIMQRAMRAMEEAAKAKKAAPKITYIKPEPKNGCMHIGTSES